MYDANHIPIKWASNEIDLLTQHLQTLENLDKKGQFIILLQQQHLQDSEQSFYSRHRCCRAHEKKRVMRIKKEQKRKKIKRQKNMEMKLAYKLLVKHMEKKRQIRSWRVALSRHCPLNSWGLSLDSTLKL